MTFIPENNIYLFQTKVYPDDVVYNKSSKKYEEQWVIEKKLHGHRDVNGVRYYKAKFKNLPGFDWIHQDNPGCIDTIRQYEHLMSMRETIETLGGYETHQKKNVNRILKEVKKRDPNFSCRTQFPAYNPVTTVGTIEQPETVISEELAERPLIPTAALSDYRVRQNKRRNRAKKLNKKATIQNQLLTE